ncbi:MAG: DUF5721 family protein [Cellulosilyticaceae bacterium]
MECYEITNKKLFMHHLLKGELFDTFELREAILHTAFKAIIEGKRNEDFFDTEQIDCLSTYLSWQEMRPYFYNLISGSTSPSYFKLILSTSKEKTLTIADSIDTCYLNIIFKNNQISCTTGVSYKTFSLDQSPNSIWDDKIKNFLLRYDFI